MNELVYLFNVCIRKFVSVYDWLCRSVYNLMGTIYLYWKRLYMYVCVFVCL